MSAPLPVLGLEKDAAKEQRLLATSRTALGFAIAALLVALLRIACALFGLRIADFETLVLGGVCWIVGLWLGVRARRTRNGKAAIVLSLLSLILGILLS